MKKLAFLCLLLIVAYAQFGPGDPLYNESYNNESILSNTFQNITDEIKNPTKSGMPSCDATPDTVKLGKELALHSFFVIFIMAMAVGLLYVVGNFFSHQPALALASMELNELIVTTFIAIFFLTVIFGQVFNQVIFGIDLFKEATDYSYKVLYKIGSISSVMISANIALNSIYTLYIPLGPIRRALTIQLGPALRPLIDGVSFSLQFLITMYGEWMVFVFMFCFIQKWFLPFFFPAGLFLRSFPQTRGGGNALLAISIALATIYPLMFYIDSIIFEQQFPTSGLFSWNTLDSAIKTIFGYFTLGGVASLFGVLSIIYVSPMLVIAILLAGYMFWTMIGDVLYLVMIFSLLLPILNIFITLSFAREVANLLGTEINISAFARLI